MKSSFLIVILTLAQAGCRNEHNQRVMHWVSDGYENIDTTSYPLLIDGGRKIVYLVGHMTPDKGLKLYFDTIPNEPAGLQLDDSVRRRLSPK